MHTQATAAHGGIIVAHGYGLKIYVDAATSSSTTESDATAKPSASTAPQAA
jgi:hypothetical protein